MNKETAKKLKEEIEVFARNFSNPLREKNGNGEVFSFESLSVLSETTAAVCYRKSPSDKLALVFFYYVNYNGGVWRYFVPTDAHILGMAAFARHKETVETVNFPKNFEAEVQIQ